MLVKYSLKALAISSVEVILESLIFNSFTMLSLADQPNKSLIVFHASLGLFFW